MEIFKHRAVSILKSLVLRLDIANDYINQEIYYRYGEEAPTDKYESVYYKNLRGIYTKYNTPIKIFSLDNGNYFILGKDSYIEHPLTIDELRKRGSFYNSILEANDRQETLMLGLLSDVTMEDLESEKIVLKYDPLLLTKNELDLIELIELMVKDFIYKHYDENLTFEDRYTPTLIAQMQASILMTILNFMLESQDTFKVDRDSMEARFDSILGVGEISPYISDRTRLWLYKNLPTLSKEISMEQTFQKVIENVLVPSGVNAYDVVYLKPKYHLNDPMDLTKSPWTIEPQVGLIDRMGESSSLVKDSFSEAVLIDKQLEDSLLTPYAKEAVKEEVRRATEQIENKNKTKSVFLKTAKVIGKVSLEKDLSVIEQFLFDAITDKLNSVQTIGIKGDNQFTVGSKNAALLFIYLMLDIVGKETDIRKIKLRNFLRNVDFDTIPQIPISDDFDLKDKIKSILPVPRSIYKHTTYVRFIHTLVNFFNRKNELISKFNNTFLNTNLELILRKCKEEKEIIIEQNGMGLDEILTIKSIPMSFYNPVKVMDVIIESFTGYKASIFDEDSDLINTFKNFLEKFISYNVKIDIFKNTKTEESSLNLVQGIGGLDYAKIEALDFSPLQPFPFNFNLNYIDLDRIWYYKEGPKILPYEDVDIHLVSDMYANDEKVINIGERPGVLVYNYVVPMMRITGPHDAVLIPFDILTTPKVQVSYDVSNYGLVHLMQMANDGVFSISKSNVGIAKLTEKEIGELLLQPGMENVMRIFRDNVYVLKDNVEFMIVDGNNNEVLVRRINENEVMLETYGFGVGNTSEAKRLRLSVDIVALDDAIKHIDKAENPLLVEEMEEIIVDLTATDERVYQKQFNVIIDDL